MLISRSKEKEEVRPFRQAADAAKKAIRRLAEPDDARDNRKRRDAEGRAAARAIEDPAQANARKQADLRRVSNRRNAVLGLAGIRGFVDTHFSGSMTQKCRHCGALYFSEESTSLGVFTKCCRNGSARIPLFEDFPDELKELFESMAPDGAHFREHSGSYNNSLATGSLKTSLDLPRGGPYCYRVHGQAYHFVGNLHPQPGQQRQFAQVFIMGTQQATEELAGRAVNKGKKRTCFSS